MSFPWKKLKKTSISQLVKDHVSSKTPLMVETGFPSSLVDLFVKNHQRFMKTCKKKAEPHVSSLSSKSLPLKSSPLTPPSPGCCTIERSQLKVYQEKGERIDLDEAVDKNMVLIALVKIFLVVVLVLGTKKLVMGITMSAFLMYFFEYSGERVYGWLMPVAGAKRRILLMVEWVWRFSGAKMVESEEEKDCVFTAPLQQEELSSSESTKDDNLICEGMDLLEPKRKKSQKSKMKRFLSKKFRRNIRNQMRENDVKTQENDKLEEFNDCQNSTEKVLDVKMDRKEQNSASIVLLLVVLVGLTGGRIFALVFTLTWCMMSKQV